MDTRTKRALWIVAGVIFVVALVAHHNITTQEIIIFCVVVPSIILHEVSHGWVARLFGDDTAARAGRLSLNPVVHVDPVGTLIVPALLALGSFGVFGWAKPVPVDVSRLRSRAIKGVLVSLAGPLVNARSLRWPSPLSSCNSSARSFWPQGASMSATRSSIGRAWSMSASLSST